ncbi:alginate lyase family protein [Desertivirga arenae]|uniref:alginate lyase family protein n=1 Tax=Desertivirga arenae TaxID=2810309 RepID=UPI001A9584C4|nr:alginate lyase family protein [Pedobacter sp. SYSU D00823]
MKRKIQLIALLIVFSALAKSQTFVHPGILHSQEDLERMKKAVAAKEEPIHSGYKLFSENPVSQSNYTMQGPMEMVGRNPTVGQAVYDTDANAAHHNAIQWAITGDRAYAEKAIEIINAWSHSLKSITGRDAVLMAGLGPFKMVNAAEIIRYTNAGWKEQDIRKTELHFREVIYPVIKNYAPFANGNWDAAALKTVMAIAVFCSDKPMFEDALRYYVNGHGNGRLTHYVINEEGQIQESGRDQGHTQLGIGMLAECSEIAWKQGLNLYGYNNNRLLKGFEYVAKFNLGNEVPFVETLDHTGKYHHKAIARQDRGPLRAVYEQVYNHYVRRMGLQAAFTRQAAEKIRPEGPGKPGADHPGYGTLFFSLPAPGNAAADSRTPVAPAGVIAEAKGRAIALSWIEPIGAKTYILRRSEKKGGPYNVLSRNILTTNYEDLTVKEGKIYYYVVSSSNGRGESNLSQEVAVSAGLPHPWKQMSIGELDHGGSTHLDGRNYTFTAWGKGLDSLNDSYHFAAVPLKQDMEITLRYVPQLSSQFSSFGISIRESESKQSRHLSLSINPGKTELIEAPAWHARLSQRLKSGQPLQLLNLVQKLPDTAVTFGRLTGYYWLRLKKEGSAVKAYVSSNGQAWTPAGSAILNFQKGWLGIFAASGMANETVVNFDNIQVR